jgi:EmrB/QacA subfamily drug resistance transporter
MFNRRGTLVVACLATAMLMLDIAVVNSALPRVARDLHAGLTGVQWIVDAYTLALATVVLTAGSLADRLGRRRIFSIGIAVFTAASAVCALAGSIAALDIARAAQGLGAAMMFAGSLALIADAFPEPASRGGAFAVYGATIGASFALGPLVGGGLTSAVNWRAVFYLNLPLGVAALVATKAWVRESRDPWGRRIDWPGQVTLTSGLLLLVLALLRGNLDGWTSAGISSGLVGSGVLLGGFLFIEQQSRSPMLPLGLFRSRAFAGAQVGAFSMSASFFALFVYITLYLQEILRLSPFTAGLVYLPSTVSLFLASAATAQLLRRVTPGLLVVSGLLLVAVGLFVTLLAGAHSSWTALLPGLFLTGIGTGLFNPALSAVALGSTPPERSGLAAGVNDTFRHAGIAVGVAAFGALVPSTGAVGRGPADEFVVGFHHALMAGGAVAAVGALACAWLLRPERPARDETPIKSRSSEPVTPDPAHHEMETTR